MDSAIPLEVLLFIALRAVARAFPEILSVYNGSFRVDTKEDLSPVTEADRRSNRIITAELSEHSPYPILSEEGRKMPFTERRSWRRFWVVDPLDGTKEFVKRNGEFTINIAVVEGNSPVLGVVYAPLPDLLYFAWEGGETPNGVRSSSRNGVRAGSYRLEGFAGLAARIPEDIVERATKLSYKRPFSFDEQRKREKVTVIGSRSHRGRHFMSYVQELERRYAERVEVKISGSALKPCLVADGSADIYPRFGPTMEWDTAAPHAVVRGVGKRMVAYDSGRELVYNKEELVNPSFLVY
ncbi:MAG: 3'(2'),5'-bisphosphate nucleotidase CysQ [Spirochaetaceae bacterium]|nr:MAG: 3'(2'),5'-bisphosphate nucleotidase CysQ [Spirochaetaceae bacterium]